MSFDFGYYIVPSLFWIAAAIIGVGVAVGVVLISRAIRDYIVEHDND